MQSKWLRFVKFSYKMMYEMIGKQVKNQRNFSSVRHISDYH